MIKLFNVCIYKGSKTVEISGGAFSRRISSTQSDIEAPESSQIHQPMKYQKVTQDLSAMELQEEGLSSESFNTEEKSMKRAAFSTMLPAVPQECHPNPDKGKVATIKASARKDRFSVIMFKERKLKILVTPIQKYRLRVWAGMQTSESVRLVS